MKKEYENVLKTRLLLPSPFITWNSFIWILVLTLLYIGVNYIVFDKSVLNLAIVVHLFTMFQVWNNFYVAFYDLKTIFYFRKKRDIVFHSDPESGEYPPIAMIIPSCNEPFDVVKMTFDSALNTRYDGKKEIVVVDNSKDTEAEDFIKLKEYVGSFEKSNKRKNVTVKFLYNTERSTLKPGNLDLAQEHIGEAEYILFLDVDSSLPENDDLLSRSVCEFVNDEKLGYIQYNLVATNDHFNAFTRANAVAQNLIRLRDHGRNYGGAGIFSGHNGIWRKEVLDKCGSWVDYFRGNIMVTEDVLKSVQAYSLGYYGKSIYVETGEWIPSSLDALETMWLRWTYGACQIIAKYFKTLLFTKTNFLLEKVGVIQHFTSYIVISATFPVLFFYQLFFSVSHVNYILLILLFVPQIAGGLAMYSSYMKKQKIPLLKKIGYLYSGMFIVNTFIFVCFLKAFINFLLGVPQGWKATAKGFENLGEWSTILYKRMFHVIVALVIFLSCLVSWIVRYDMAPAKIINFLPMILISFHIMACIVLYGKDGRQKHNDTLSATIDARNNC